MASTSLNAIWVEYAAKMLAQQIDSAVLTSFYADVIDPPLMTIDLDDDDLSARLDEIARHIEAMEQDNERIKVAITTNTSGTGGLITKTDPWSTVNIGPQAPPEAKASPRKSVTMTITKVVNGHTVSVGDRTYVCSGEEDLANIVITALADVKLGG